LALAIVAFLTTKMIFNRFAAKVCSLARAAPLRIILINNNAMLHKLILVWALSKNFDWLMIMFVSFVDLMTASVHTFFVCGPLQVHANKQPWPVLLFYWMFGKDREILKRLTKQEQLAAITERAKWVYFIVLNGMQDAIMPVWQVVFYYLTNSTTTRSAFSGFEKTINGFKKIDPYTMVLCSTFLAALDIMTFGYFTYMIRKKFPNFQPFIILNVVMKKFGVVLSLSILSIVLSVQCMMIIDCKVDITINGLKGGFPA